MADTSSQNLPSELYPQKGKSLHYLAIAFIIVTGIALVLRFWSRATITHGKKFGSDDWTALGSWPLVLGLNIIVIMWTRAGLGLHIQDVPPYFIEKGLKILYAGYFFYDSGITVIRISTVCFYGRVFQDQSKIFRICYWTTIGLAIAWFWAIWGLSAFSCTPIEAAWDKTIPGAHCEGVLKILLASGVTSCLLDFWILIMPLPLLWKLQMNITRKILIIGVFFAGYCIIVFTIGRTVAVFNVADTINEDVTWAFTTGLYWYVCEINVAFVSITMPSLFHLFRRAARHGAGALFNDHDYTHGSRPRLSTMPSRHDHDEGFVRLNSDGKDKDQDLELHALETGGGPYKGGVTTSTACGGKP